MVIDYCVLGYEKFFCYIKFIVSGVCVISKWNYDFIYFYYLIYLIFCFIFFLLVGKLRYVVNIYGDDFVGSIIMYKVMGFVFKLILKKSVVVVVLFFYFKDKLFELYFWYNKDKIIVFLFGGVDFDVFKLIISFFLFVFILGYVF